MTDLDVFKQRFDYEQWRGANALEEELFVQGFVPPLDLLDPWTAARVQLIDGPDWPRTTESIWQLTPDDHDRLVRLDIFESDSRQAAHDFLVRMLGNFQSPLIRRDGGAALGDVTFTGRSSSFALFARANLVVMLRNAGPEIVPVGELAGRIDELMVARPREGGVAVPTIERFGPDVETKGREIPLHVQVFDPLESAVWFKVFTRGGAVARSGDSLVLRPDEKGPTQVTLFAINEASGVASTTFELP